MSLSSCIQKAGDFLSAKDKQALEQLAQDHIIDGMPVNDAEAASVKAQLKIIDALLGTKQGDVTETPAFKSWFGDSKVVDADGKPMVVYHGTQNDVSAFGRGEGGGMWFSSTPDIANRHAERSGGERANVMPVYLKMQNPVVVDGKKADVGAAINEAYKNGHDGVIAKGKGDLGADGDVYFVFNPEQIKSATGNDGKFDANSPDITRSVPRPAFYSQLELAVEEVPDRLATMAAPQWKLWLDANASKFGVKKDEIEWSGVKDYLDMRGKDKVTRDEIGAYLRDNGVKVKEVVLDDAALSGKEADEALYAWAEANEKSGEFSRRFTDAIMRGSPSETILHVAKEERIQGEPMRLAQAAVDGFNNEGTDTKFASYVVPGGQNYREVLLTLPTKAQAQEKQFRTSYQLFEDGELFSQGDQRSADRWRRMNPDADIRPVQVETQDSRAATPEGSYTSSHWDQPNVLAHMRVDDRTDADGKKVLFLNDIQSDWGQQGKKDGFAKPDDIKPVTSKQFNAFVDELLDVYIAQRVMAGESRNDAGRRGIDMPTQQLAQELGRGDEYARMRAGRDLEFDDSGDKVPRAPFVTKTESWVGLALKRAITMAVDGGYDKVAFVNGEQAVDMFDLSKSVKKIRWNSGAVAFREVSVDFGDHYLMLNVDQKGVVDAAPDASSAMRSQMVGKPLDEVVGKGVAERIMDGGKDGFGELSGDGLKIGGEGMKAFYDKIVPQVANDVLKKLGGGKVAPVSVGDGSRFSGGVSGMDAMVGAGVPESEHRSYWENLSQPERDEMIEAERVRLSKPLTQQGFDITPAMREKLVGGAPMFSKAREVENTPEFKKWFGDSKVVDAAGKPLVVYHGTPHGSIRQFEMGVDGAGWFAADPSIADGFSEMHDDAAVYPVYLSLQNPLDTRTEEGKKIFRSLINKDSDARISTEVARGGYDGLIGQEGAGHTTYLAFRPVQIKSAIGNDGNFDSRTPDITRSVGRDTQLMDGFKVSDFLDSSKKVSWWDKTVGSPFHMAAKHPSFKRVYDAVQDFIGGVSSYATKAADMAPNILPKLENLRDITKSPLSGADVKALSDPIFKGTLTYARDANGDAVIAKDVGSAGVVWSDAELRDKWNLNPDQIALYREFRKATNKSIADMAVTQMVRMAGAHGDGVRGRVLAAPTVKQSAEILADHLGWLAANDPTIANTLMNTARSVGELADTARGLMAKGYAPLSRFGDYTVYVTRNNGADQVYFGMYETEREANRAARAFQEDPHFADAKVQTGTMSKEAHKLFKGVTPETLALFGEALGLDESSTTQESQVFQEFLKLAKTNRSAMKHMIERKGVAGYSEDAGRVLASFIYSNARQASTNLHAGDIAKAQNDVPEGDLKDHAIKMVEYVNAAQDENNAMRGLLFANYIGGSIASAAVNLTQSLTTTWPTLSQHYGIGKSGRELAAALGVLKNGAGADTDLADAMKRAEQEGITDPNETHQLQAQAAGRGSLQSGDGTTLGDNLAKAKNSIAKLGLIWGKSFGLAETINRKIAFVAAYKLAREAGDQNPYEMATRIVKESQFVMNKGNNPVWARGPVGATLFTFKKFGIFYLENLARMWGNGPEGKKAFALSLAIMFMMGGAGGMPFEDDLSNLIDAFMQRVLNKSFSSKLEKKQFFAKYLGDAGSDFILSGLSGLPGAPIDVSGRMGMAHLVPGSGLLTKKQDHTSDVTELGGPAADFVKKFLTAAGDIATGEPKQAIQDVAPTAVANALKMADMLQTGSYRDAKGRKVIDTNPTEAIMKGIGFQPASVAQIQEASGISQDLIGQNKMRSIEIGDKWAKGRIDKDPALIAEAQAELKQWNEDNPESKITVSSSGINKRVQEANMDKAKRIAKAAPKGIKATVKEELASAMPAQ